MYLVNYGHPIYKSVVVMGSRPDEASDKAREYIEGELGYDLNGVQVSCFGVHNDVKIL